ncbi:Trafficking protein particle complex subunit 8 [Camellia lanceoleosa]|uniref:Trafficking protein particle complex subunit 8 n=1 Tax=Camellia lanceoleosa TaxID=1840588 RepID=A0ACC0FT60_9ERIC|nr:Trafficking protein particle complex subunit 8 [Camellia lanceoleosa]
MVDPANTPLGRMLLDEITPVVMVLRTNLIEETCQKNGLSLIQMLSPFCAFNNIDVPVRTASDQPYRLQKFTLRLFYASDIRQPNVEGRKIFRTLCSDPPQIETVLTTSQSELIPSWFPFINKELVRTVSFSDHEAFDHAVACLLVVSSKDEEPINRFVDLFNSDQLPSLLSDGAMDPKILKYYLLLHDNQDGTSEKTTKFLTEMRSTFGSNDCGLLCVNSSPDGLVEHQENPWALYRTESSSNHHLGCFLNIDDMDELQNVMQDLSSRHIIPHMEQKIRVLNQQLLPPSVAIHQSLTLGQRHRHSNTTHCCSTFVVIELGLSSVVISQSSSISRGSTTAKGYPRTSVDIVVCRNPSVLVAFVIANWRVGFTQSSLLTRHNWKWTLFILLNSCQQHHC